MNPGIIGAGQNAPLMHIPPLDQNSTAGGMLLANLMQQQQQQLPQLSQNMSAMAEHQQQMMQQHSNQANAMIGLPLHGNSAAAAAAAASMQAFAHLQHQHQQQQQQQQQHNGLGAAGLNTVDTCTLLSSAELMSMGGGSGGGVENMAPSGPTLLQPPPSQHSMGGHGTSPVAQEAGSTALSAGQPMQQPSFTTATGAPFESLQAPNNGILMQHQQQQQQFAPHYQTLAAAAACHMSMSSAQPTPPQLLSSIAAAAAGGCGVSHQQQQYHPPTNCWPALMQFYHQQSPHSGAAINVSSAAGVYR